MRNGPRDTRLHLTPALVTVDDLQLGSELNLPVLDFMNLLLDTQEKKTAPWLASRMSRIVKSDADGEHQVYIIVRNCE